MWLRLETFLDELITQFDWLNLVAQPLNLAFNVSCNAMNYLIKSLKSNESVLNSFINMDRKKEGTMLCQSMISSSKDKG